MWWIAHSEEKQVQTRVDLDYFTIAFLRDQMKREFPNHFRIFRVRKQKPKLTESMTTEAATTAALYNALAWLDAKKKDAGVDTENVEVGIQCIRCVAEHADARRGGKWRMVRVGLVADIPWFSFSYYAQRGVRRECAGRAAQAAVCASQCGVVRGRVCCGREGAWA